MTTLVERRLLEPGGEERRAALRPHPGARRRVRRAGQGRAGPPARRRGGARGCSAAAAAQPATPTSRPPRRASGPCGWPPRWGCRRATRPGRPAGIAFAALARLGQAALARDDRPPRRGRARRALALADRRTASALPADLVVPVRVAHAPGARGAAPAGRGGGRARRRRSSGAEEALRAGALVVLGDVRRKRGDLQGAREAFVSALAAASSAGVDRLAGEALRQLGLLDYFDGRLRDGRGALPAGARAGRAGRRPARRRLGAAAPGVERDHPRRLRPRRRRCSSRPPRCSPTLRGQRRAVLGGRHRGLRPAAAGPAAARPASWPGRCCRSARRWASAGASPRCSPSTRWPPPSSATSPVAAEEAERARGALRRRSATTGGRRWRCRAAGIAARGAAATRTGRSALHDEAVALAERAHPLVAGLALVAAGYAHLDRGDLDAAEGAAWRASAAARRARPRAARRASARRCCWRRCCAAAASCARRWRSSTRRSAPPARPRCCSPAGRRWRTGPARCSSSGRAHEALAAARAAVGSPRARTCARGCSALRALGAALRAAGEPERGREALEEALAGGPRRPGQRSEVATTERLLAER